MSGPCEAPPASAWTALRQVAEELGYLVLGAGGTALVALIALPLTDSLQGVVYDLTYRSRGPAGATTLATVVHFLAVGAVALALPAAAGQTLRGGTGNLREAAVGAAVLGLLVVLSVAAGLVTGAAFAVPVAVALIVLSTPLVARYRFDLRSGGLAALSGSVPVFLVLLLALGFGLGWGWGYTVTARELPEGPGEGVEVVDVAEAPALDEDLFAATACEENSTGVRTCRLELRGYEREREVARFLDRHGVRCPFANSAASAEPSSVVLERDGAHYRVACEAHGD